MTPMPYYETLFGKLYCGEHPFATIDIPDNTFDSIVTDPPYGLKFMGKKWDYSVPIVEMWVEFLRVLKPGGYLLSFGGARTYHRMVCNIEDAGFTIHPQMGWIYGSGFPKATNLSKQIDKSKGLKQEIIGKRKHPTLKDSTKINRQNSTQYHADNGIKDEWDITAPTSPEAQQWAGWSYGLQSLKPAMEPICMAQKPANGRMVDNVLKYGVGAVNIDGCRVPINLEADKGQLRTINRSQRVDDVNGQEWGMTKEAGDNPQVIKETGRHPANIIHDGSDEVLALFPDTNSRKGKNRTAEVNNQTPLLNSKQVQVNCEYDDSGSAARFFYCAKASKKDRGVGNTWPTVKPQSLIKYLVKLVTPPSGICLDPFGGSGTTAIVCEELCFQWALFDMSTEACDITVKRLDAQAEQLNHEDI